MERLCRFTCQLNREICGGLDIENLPEPPICLDSEKKEIVNNSKLFEESIEKTDIA